MFILVLDSAAEEHNHDDKKEKPVATGIHPDSHDLLTSDVKLPAASSGSDKSNPAAQSQKIPILIAILLLVPIVIVLLVLLGFKLYNMSKL